MRRILLMAATVCVLSGGGAGAQTRHYEVTVNPSDKTEGYGKVSVDRAAIGSTKIRIWSNTAVEPDCSPHGETTLTVIHPPEHGTVTISDEPFFYNFAPSSLRAECSKHKVPGHQAFYTATAGYGGNDKVVLEGAQPDGAVRRITVNISVR